MVRPGNYIFWLLLCLLLQATGTVNAVAKPVLDNETFAIINGERISSVTYLSALNSGIRQRFYHGKIPQAELTAFRREVADKMVDSMLLLQEAKRRNITADPQLVQQQLDAYERRYGESAEWLARRETLLPGLRTQLENQIILKRITTQLKQVALPDHASVQRYYQQHPDKFTTPLKRKVSLILLKVDPSSPREVWEQARTEAAAIIQRIRAGESFAELAKIHSADAQSARKGGDMGYLHQGMLAEEAEAVLDTLKAGELSEPVRTLHGFVVLRLEEISEAHLNSYAKVSERAAALLQRELAEQQYQQVLRVLRGQAAIEVNTALISQ